MDGAEGKPYAEPPSRREGEQGEDGRWRMADGHRRPRHRSGAGFAWFAYFAVKIFVFSAFLAVKPSPALIL